MALNLPSASGASGEEPFGWGLIESAAGLAWPDGHQDQLRAAKTVWHILSELRQMLIETAAVGTATG
ncbi:hypothetical protein [Nocardia farcinica]|uniref:hypothetical protein n=1 Tax=Nocardia farcinica TaxID=37329 RepID=UPI0011C07A01|nr:hypothetical protein [Nocardia farcinica]